MGSSAVDTQELLNAWESDWALGELLHLISEGKRLGVMAHELNPALFSVCMRVMASEPFELRQQMHRIIVGTEFWRVYRYRYAYA